MKNQTVKNLLRKVVVVAFAGVIIVSVVACGKPEEATVQTGGATTFETMEETHEVDTPDLITGQEEQEFNWEDRDLTDTQIQVDKATSIYAEPRVSSEQKGSLDAGVELDAVAEAFQGEKYLGFFKVAEGYVNAEDAHIIILDAVYYEDGLAESAGITVQNETIEEKGTDGELVTEGDGEPIEQAQAETQTPPQETQPPQTQPPAQSDDDFAAWAAQFAEQWGVNYEVPPSPEEGAGENITGSWHF